MSYKINKFGFRDTVGGNSPHSPTYLFFGGSFTYGEGVTNADTYPSRFSEKLNHQYTVVNLGWHGYGPHQMLRAIEKNLFRDAITGDVKQAFYLLISDHLSRVAGYHHFNIGSPRYVLESNGLPKFAGFHKESWLRRKRNGLLGLLAQFVYENLYMSIETRQALTVAIIKKSKFLLEKKYRSNFTCLIWDDAASWKKSKVDIDKFESALIAEGIEVVRISKFLGDLNSPKFKIHSLDGHPSALAHGILGNLLAKRIQGIRQ